MAWKKIAFLDEVAVLSDEIPLAVDGSAGSAGVGTEASRDDHVHALGPLVADLDFDQQQALSLVLEAVDEPPDAAAEVEGQIYFDVGVGDKHAYIWVP